MKTNLRVIAAVLLLLLVPSVTKAQQNTLTQTTLSAAVTTSYATVVQVASATGITAPGQNGSTAKDIYVDGELMYVVAVNGTTLTVARGQAGTRAVAHASGAMVLSGKPNYFYTVDPGGSCTAANVFVSPYLNIKTGAQWLCSSQTGTWVPGWSNPLATDEAAVSASVASAAGTITPSGPLFHITGTAAITGFVVPLGFNATTVGGGSFCAIPDGIFTTTAAGNIALASTAVVNKKLCWTWDAKNSKFVPSY